MNGIVFVKMRKTLLNLNKKYKFDKVLLNEKNSDRQLRKI